MTGELYPTKRDVLIGVVTFAGIVGAVGMISMGVYRVATQERQKEDKLNAFIAECIELHPESRCKEFWRYNRTDLGRK